MPPATYSSPVSSVPPPRELDSAKDMIDSRNTIQKRNRAQLSCTNCRHAKLKCDRKEPCSQCIKRGKGSLCIIPKPAPRRKPAASMQNRLKHLESLVKGAMSSQIPIESQNLGSSQMALPSRNVITPSSDATEISSGKVLVDNNETTYVGATHWAAILEDVCHFQASWTRVDGYQIEEVKTYFYEEAEAENNDEEWPTAALSFDIESPATMLDLFAALPSRIIVDQLLSRYFNSNSPTLRESILAIQPPQRCKPLTATHISIQI